MALEGLENILKVGVCDREESHVATNPYATLIDEAEGLEKIETLQTHTNDDIYNKARKPAFYYAPAPCLRVPLCRG